MCMDEGYRSLWEEIDIVREDGGRVGVYARGGTQQVTSLSISSL